MVVPVALDRSPDRTAARSWRRSCRCSPWTATNRDWRTASACCPTRAPVTPRSSTPDDRTLQQRFAEEIPASRILVNGAATLGLHRVGDGLTPSLTLGCGTFGGNSTTDNVTYTHLLNIKRVARPFI